MMIEDKARRGSEWLRKIPLNANKKKSLLFVLLRVHWYARPRF